MEIGMMTRWGAAKPGREKESVALYDRAVAYCRRLVQEGKLTYFEPFFFSSGDSEVELGFFITRGPAADFFAILESEEYRHIMTQSHLVLEHFRTDMLTVGEGIDRRRADYNKVLADASA